MDLVRSLAALTVAALLSAPVVRAQTPSVQAQCATAYTQGQDDRLAGRLYAARTAFRRCAAATCSAALQHDCARWASEVEADLPTVVLRVGSVPGLVATADGAPLPASAWSQPLVLEAGPHTLRFEAPGYEPLIVQTALRPTDREVVVGGTLLRQGVATRTPQARAISPISVVLAGTGTLALGAGLYLGLDARSRYRELEDSCAPRCARSEANSVHREAVVADFALATSLLAWGAASWIYFSQAAQPRVALAVAPRSATLRVDF